MIQIFIFLHQWSIYKLNKQKKLTYKSQSLIICCCCCMCKWTEEEDNKKLQQRVFRHGGSLFRHGDESFPILNFLCGFCRGDEGESLYGDDFLNDSLWCLRSSHEGSSWEIKKCLQSTDYSYFISIILQIKSV